MTHYQISYRNVAGNTGVVITGYAGGLLIKRMNIAICATRESLIQKIAEIAIHMAFRGIEVRG